MGPEANLRAGVLRALHRTSGVCVWGWPASAFTGAGHPDLFGVFCGRFFALELKSRTGRATWRQRIAIRDIRKAGGYAWIVRSVQQAVAVMALIENGEHPPMTDSPLEIDDWFKDLPNFEGQAAPATAEPETAPADEIEWLADPTPADETLLVIEGEDSVPGPTHEEVLQDLDARAEALDDVPQEPKQMEAVAKATRKRVPTGTYKAESLPAFTPEQQQMEVAIEEMNTLKRIDQDIRTVGDRITMVHEENTNLRLELTVMRNVVQALEKAVNDLIALISDEEFSDVAPEPEPIATAEPTRRTRRKAS
jgi:hypothetical protein